MKKAVSILLTFILMFNISLGYTLTVNTARGMTTRDVASDRIVTVGLSDRSPANYVVNTANTILKVFGNRRQFVMPEANVGITISAKSEEEIGTVFAEIAEVGEYVTYSPTATVCDLTTLTGITQDSFNPSLTTKWRVLSNDGETVEIVSAESVGNLKLGKVATTYNGGTTFAEGTAEDMAFAADEKKDVDILKAYDMLPDDGSVWLAMRWMGMNERASSFSIKCMNIKGKIEGLGILHSYTNDSTIASLQRIAGVRPVVILKPEIALSGSGTLEKPWVLN